MATEDSDAGQIQEGDVIETPPIGKNSRPDNVRTLIVDAHLYGGWAYHNRVATRFFVANIITVMETLSFSHTTMRDDFRLAEETIKSDTKWKEQLNFDYKCSHTQIYPDVLRDVKLFGRAATIIIALEIIAARLKSSCNVYDHLRILPADRFVARFVPDRLEEFRGFYRRMTADHREQAFGEKPPQTFDAACQRAIKQREDGRLLIQLTEGFCVTRHVADALVTLLNSSHFPAELHVGPVSSAGEDMLIDSEANQKLGKKNAAPDLYIPRTLDVSTCPLS